MEKDTIKQALMPLTREYRSLVYDRCQGLGESHPDKSNSMHGV